MDQQLIWNDLLMNPVESENLPGDSSMPFIDLTDEEPADLSIWNSSGPSPSIHSLNHGAPEEAKREHNWASPLTINESQGSRRAEERQLEITNMVLGSRTDEGRFGDVNLTLNSGHADVSQLVSQNPNFLQLSAPIEGQVQFSVPFMPGSSGVSSNLSVNTSSGIEGRPGSSFDGRRLSNKRKNIEGVSSSGSSSCLYRSENSAHQSANTALSIASSSNYPLGMNPAGSGTTDSVQASDRHAYNITGRGESSQRNCRSRINPSQQSAPSPNQWPSGNNLPSHQASNLLVPFNQSLDLRAFVATGTLESQPPVLPVPVSIQNIHSFPLNAASRGSTRTTNSSSRSPMAAGQIVSEHSAFAPPPEVRNLMQHSTSWSLATPTLQNGNSARVVRPSGPAWMPHQNSPSQPQRRSLVPSGGPGSGQSVNVPPLPPPAVSSTLQEMRAQRVSLVRGLQQPVPLSLRSLAATRESRSRMLEIRNAIQNAWRGERIQLEDAIFDHAVFIGGPADLHDRHRDMWLDVDNMSYEELLALEERIGNVNTGLSEEKVLKHLKQRIYISLSEQTPSEVEPCCICQEEYVEGQDIGRLDCGHDFHTACIKQWLMLKNLCPICKTTGLVS